jgi:pimeloyl-ACP methyl ester carboxylesterase
MSEIEFKTLQANLDSGPLHYIQGGKGPPILHLHSSGGPRVTAVTEQLARRHTIYMPTVPGFEGTATHATVKTMVDLADLSAKFVRTVVGGPCDVVSESFGGWTALWLAARHPDLVEQLVLQAPAGLRIGGGVPADPAERFRMLFAVPERAPKETRSAQVLARNQQVRDGYVGGVSLDTALQDALPSIKARTLVLMGTLDEVVPIDTARRLKAGLLNAHVSYVYGAAHALEYDQPQRVARLIGAFLEHGEAFLVRRPGSA